jgi:hypothetical protein
MSCFFFFFFFFFFFLSARACGGSRYEAISFDNILLAVSAVFQVVTLEGWAFVLYGLQDAHSFWVWPFFVALILLGSWFAVNLALVVIATQFKSTKRRCLSMLPFHLSLEPLDFSPLHFLLLFFCLSFVLDPRERGRERGG